jgi:hypothetical protein
MRTASICIFQKLEYLGSVLISKRIGGTTDVSEANRQKVYVGAVYPRWGISLSVKDL